MGVIYTLLVSLLGSPSERHPNGYTWTAMSKGPFRGRRFEVSLVRSKWPSRKIVVSRSGIDMTSYREWHQGEPLRGLTEMLAIFER